MDPLAWHQRWPVVPAAICYFAGVATGHSLESSIPLLLLGASVVAVAAALVCPGRRWLVAALWLTLGWLNVSVQSQPWRRTDLRHVAAARPEIVTLRGTLAATPETRSTESRGRTFEHSTVEMIVREVRRAGAWHTARGRVLATTPAPLADAFFAGRTVEVEGVLQPPDGPVATGLFHYRRYLETLGIHFVLRTDSTNDWRWTPSREDPARPPLGDRFRAWGERTLAVGLPPTNTAVRLQTAMVLGLRTAMTDEMSEPFTRSGTMHIFAISGLHIMLAAEILVQLLRFLQLPRSACGLLVAPTLWFYTAATGWQPSAIRSALMMSIIIGGWALRRPSDLLNSLATAGLAILLWDPRQLFAAGFQLSFFVVLSLALFLPPLEAVSDRWLAPDPFLPDHLRPRWKEKLRRGARRICMSTAVSLAAWIGALPLVALYFHLLTPVSLLANLVVVPLSTLALMCGIGSLACGAWTDTLTSWFNHAGWFWMESMVRSSQVAASLPGAWFPVVSPPWFVLTAYYATLVALALHCTPLLRPPRQFVLVLALTLPVALGTWATQAFLHRSDVILTVLGLRSGECTVCRHPTTPRTLLIDAGDETSGRSVVCRYLQSLGLRTLPALVLTHGDIRHAGGASPVLDRLRLQTIAASPARTRSKAYQSALETARAHGTRQLTLSRGDEVDGWQILHPAAQDRFTRADDQAIVLRARWHGVTVLFCSDLGPLAQRALLEREPDLRADLLIAGMPNGSEPLSDALLDAVHPQVIVVNSSPFPASQLPSRTLQRRLEHRRIPVFFTHSTGTVDIRLHPQGWSVTAMDGTRFDHPHPHAPTRQPSPGT